jgi:hypothetical protein
MTYDLTGKKLSYFIDFITKEHSEPFSITYWVEDIDLNDILSRFKPSPFLKECYVTHCYKPIDSRFKALPLGVKFHAKDIIGDWKYEGKKKLLLICHSENTHPHRKLFPEWCKNLPWVTSQYNTSPEHYFILLQQHHYMVCPRGYSIDTYRVWECFENNIIPIVDTDYYDQFPEYAGKYLKVDDFFSITEDFLLEKLKYFK